MKIFLDTANVKEIQEAAERGLIDGVTTNPSLIAKEGREFSELIKEITAIVKGPVSAEVLALDYPEMVEEGRRLAAIHENIVVKVPTTLDGLKAVRSLSTEGIKVNVTLIFSANQALLAAKAGAAYVSPFVGRLDDVTNPGMEIVEQIVTIFDNYAFDTEVLVASIRHPIHVLEAALMGADVVTMPPAVLRQLVNHPLTDIGVERFRSDWFKAGLGKP